MPKRVLIVDDQDDVRRLLADALTLFDDELSVLEANDGASALATLRAQPADLVVTDLDMPVMNGFELIRKLRAQPSPPPIVVISGATGDWISASAGDELEGLPVLRKPLHLAQLVRVIREQLDD